MPEAVAGVRVRLRVHLPHIGLAELRLLLPELGEAGRVLPQQMVVERCGLARDLEAVDCLALGGAALGQVNEVSYHYLQG